MIFPDQTLAFDDVETLFRDQMDINDQMSARPQDAVVIEGYATRWGRRDREGETIKRGAFTASLHLSQSARGLFMLRQHDENMWPAGKWTTVREDDVGLWCRGSLYPKRCPPDLLKDVKARKITELSVGYYAYERQGLLRKTISRAWLTEISVGQNPALPGSTFEIVKS